MSDMPSMPPPGGCPWIDRDAGPAQAGDAALRLAVAGKGGSGKTTITGTLARVLGQSGRLVLAVDADTNPNLATTLGVATAGAATVVGLPRSLVQRQPQADGSTRPVFVGDAVDVVRQYGVEAPDDVRLLVMGAVGHGGAG